MDIELKASSYYQSIWEIATDTELSLLYKYRLLRGLFERICKAEMLTVDLQATDLSARISFIADKFELSYIEQQRLHSFRLTSNALLNAEAEPEEEAFYRDLKTVSFFVRKLYEVSIPDELYAILPKADATYRVKNYGDKTIQKIRVCFQYADADFLYVIPLDDLTKEPVRVRYDVPDVNEEFTPSCEQFWPHAQLNLLDVQVDEEGIMTPRLLVLEPDYLLDISALAECFRPYGAHPANYILSRLQPINNPRPLLLGSIANHFLDEWIYAEGELSYKESMQKVFKKYAIELASCPDLENRKEEHIFFQDCKTHFDNIGEVINKTFEQDGYKLDKSDAVLEPSYICEALGVQGRLDYMQRDMSSFIEMKSGRADEYALRGKVVPHLNNRVQMLLYQAVLNYNMGMERKDVRSYLLYTRYPLLYPARTSARLIRQAINLRNEIVATEYQIQSKNSPTYTDLIIREITPEQLNLEQLKGRFWNDYLSPSISQLQTKLSKLSIDERAYFYAIYNFITKELYTSKSGDMAYEGRRGASTLWNASFTEKCEEGAILFNLRIADNQAASLHNPHIVLKRDLNCNPNEVLPNFRLGDVVVLYERNTPDDSVTNKLVFKANISSITDTHLIVRLRAAQQNLDVLPTDSYYAIEPDSMDTSYRNMYLGLDAFISANQERRDLILGKRKPEFSSDYDERIATASTDLEAIVCQALSAKDYFLLVGPPGTGKTSYALRSMVEAFYADNKTILLLSYTNQAVNEICKALSRITPELDYIRIGSELSCEEAYRSHLVENVLEKCTNRSQVRTRLAKCNVFVGTVASISGKPELFRLKSFDVAIIDEASQILEPQLLGLLSLKDKQGENAIGKFVLIGDHKQLPAVVQQKEETSAINDKGLNKLHIYNMRDALFERLYRIDAPKSIAWLTKQGRMHPEVAQFANVHFYKNRLGSLNLDHQLEDCKPIDSLFLRPMDETETQLSSRVTFVEAQLVMASESNKVNESEADIAASIAHQIYLKYGDDFDSNVTLGVITPYRSQIALIKRKLEQYETPQLNAILVDTVERFQGSERDIIIYSFCVNSPYQLDFLCNILIEDDSEIDRKLNVALTRARKQLFLTGVPHVLRLNSIYRSLLDYVEIK